MPAPGLRAGPKGTLPQQKIPTFPLSPHSTQSPTTKYLLSLTCLTPVWLQFSLLLSTAIFSQGVA